MRVCKGYTLAGLDAMAEARGSRTSPFRFLYMSGAGINRDSSKKPFYMGDYMLMRVSYNLRHFDIQAADNALGGGGEESH